jgi:hypothetical protein
MRRTATAWLAMVTAVGVHVIDEALTGFLAFYNPLVLSMRQRFGFFPMPIFTFPVWIAGLTLAVLIGFALTPAVARGGRVIRVVCGSLSVLMIGNACGHMLGSVYFGRLLPGFWSSPFLLAASVWMLVRVISAWNHRG